MHHSKAQLIVGGGIGLLAFLGVALSLLRPSSVPLQERVEAFYPKFSETAQQRHADVDKKIATLEGFSREDVDAFALESQKRAAKAREGGRFAGSVVPV